MLASRLTHLIIITTVLLLSSTANAVGQLSPLRISSPSNYAVVQAETVTVTVAATATVNLATASLKVNGRFLPGRLVSTPSGLEAVVGEPDGLVFSGDNTVLNAGRNSIYVFADGIGSNANRRYCACVHFFLRRPDTSVTMSIPREGGMISLPGFGSAVIPPGAFSTSQTLTLSAVRDSEATTRFEATSLLWQPENRLGFGLRLVTGTRQPSLPIQIIFSADSTYRTSLGGTVEVRGFASNLWSGEEGEPDENHDSFEILSERLLPDSPSFAFTLPTWAFSDERRSDRAFEAIIFLATTETRVLPFQVGPPLPHTAVVVGEIATPGDPSSLAPGWVRVNAAEDPCQGSSIDAPVAEPYRITSGYGERVHPITGVKKKHHGVDFGVPVGTPVLAASDGVIEAARWENPNRQSQGYGWQIIVKHSDGSRSRYAHLTPNSNTVAVNQPVTRGQPIGLSGNSGSGTAPHLHFEYAPNGVIFRGDGRINPVPCFGQNVAGSIAISDNGSLADDAFRVLINGRAICETQIGQPNNCAASNLRPGVATLTVLCLIAPDNVGTYLISLSDGLTFEGGGTSRSGVIQQAASASFSIRVPEP